MYHSYSVCALCVLYCVGVEREDSLPEGRVAGDKGGDRARVQADTKGDSSE